jgi:hypothetical protein
MANPVLADLQATVAATTSVEDSATMLINGFAARVQAAVDQAIANGASAAELAPVQAEVDALKAASDALSQAVAANTPSA